MDSEKNMESGGEAKPEVKTYSAQEFNGLLADKQAEVRKRQEAEKRASELEGQLSQFKAATPPATAANDDSRPLTLAEFRRLMDEQRKTDQQNAQAARLAESEKLAAADYSSDKCGEGLDYASVITAGEKNLTEGDRLAIREAQNPAAEKYRRCILLTPDLAARQEAVRTARLLEQIKLNGRVPASGGEVRMATTDISRMSQEELDRLAESLG